ncbi:MAG: transcriptional regulator NanR [Amaricoccus sp.]|uniref:transcriptional regulator NanR n=1 Tax=Amaricoccus sp. TaxID=1872485 RepID=UPI0039E486FC
MDSAPWGTGRPAGDKIVRRKLSDQVLERMQDLILSGDLGPGAPMPSEHQLMERFGVGRPAVREALQSLHTMGLITISHGERSRVNALSAEAVLRQGDAIARTLLSTGPQNLEHLKEARRLFEIGMVRAGTPRATTGDIAELRALIDLQRGKLGDAEAFVGADIDFHRRIAALAGNPICSAVAEAMLGWLFRFHSDLLLWSGHEEVTLAEHSAIVDAIAAGDTDRAATAMTAHLDRSTALYQHPG